MENAKQRDKYKSLSLALWVFGYCAKAYSCLINIYSPLLKQNSSFEPR